MNRSVSLSLSTPPQNPAQAEPGEAPALVPDAYEAPQVRDLGAWQALTLIYTVPFNGGTSAGGDGGQTTFGVWTNKF